MKSLPDLAASGYWHCSRCGVLETFHDDDDLDHRPQDDLNGAGPHCPYCHLPVRWEPPALEDEFLSRALATYTKEELEYLSTGLRHRFHCTLSRPADMQGLLLLGYAPQLPAVMGLSPLCTGRDAWTIAEALLKTV